MIKKIVKNILLVACMASVSFSCDAMLRHMLSKNNLPTYQEATRPYLVTHDATLSLSVLLSSVFGVNEKALPFFEEKMRNLGLCNMLFGYPDIFNETDKNLGLRKFFDYINLVMDEIFGEGVMVFSDESTKKHNAFARVKINKNVSIKDYRAIKDNDPSLEEVKNNLVILFEHSTKKNILLGVLGRALAYVEGTAQELTKNIEYPSTYREDDLSFASVSPQEIVNDFNRAFRAAQDKKLYRIRKKADPSLNCIDGI